MEDLTKRLKEVEMVELMDIAKTIAVEINTKLIDLKNQDTEVKFLLEVKKEIGCGYDNFWLSIIPKYEMSGFITKVSIPLTSSLSRALYLMHKDDDNFNGNIGFSLYTFLVNTSATIDVLNFNSFNNHFQLQLEASKAINIVPEKDDVFTMFWAAVTNELFNSIKPNDEITKFKTNIKIVKG